MSVARSRPEINLEKGEKLVSEAVVRGSDMICFPEMWTTGFDWSGNKKTAAGHLDTIEKIAAMAKRKGIWITGSVASYNDDGRISNTAILFDPRGVKMAIYSKTHLFSFGEEDRHMKPGDALTATETPWGRMGFSICYEIRFPEIYRTYALMGAKLVFVPAAFPKIRIDHWKVLLRARAIENQMFIVAANQTGSEHLDPGGMTEYGGNSAVIDPMGRTVVTAGDEEALLTATIDLEVVDAERDRFKVLKDRRPVLYNLGLNNS